MGGFVGRTQGERNRAATPGKPRNRRYNPQIRIGYLHTVLEDHSQVVYTEMCDDETAATAVAVLRRAVAWFTTRGVTVRAVLSDNGSCYRSHLWRDACSELGIKPRRTRPDRSQTNESSGSTSPWSRGERSADSTPAGRNAERSRWTGSTSTTITDPTPPAGPPTHHRVINLPDQYS